MNEALFYAIAKIIVSRCKETAEGGATFELNADCTIDPIQETALAIAKQIIQAFTEVGGVFLTPSLSFELAGTRPEFQDGLAKLLNFASAMGDYGDPYGLLAVISPTSGKILKIEEDKSIPMKGKLEEDKEVG